MKRVKLAGGRIETTALGLGTAPLGGLFAPLSDADAEEAFSRMQDALASHIEKARLNALGAAISEFDFERALTKLDEIATEYNLNGGQATR